MKDAPANLVKPRWGRGFAYQKIHRTLIVEVKLASDFQAVQCNFAGACAQLRANNSPASFEGPAGGSKPALSILRDGGKWWCSTAMITTIDSLISNQSMSRFRWAWSLEWVVCQTSSLTIPKLPSGLVDPICILWQTNMAMDNPIAQEIRLSNRNKIFIKAYKVHDT